ncbi:hypothetical protein C0993_000167 [Termitomyces sp. T159_Od127]|nr:hypothetical protein C0993_000167 [Termitomyces sp. T159_Od127]
MRIKKHGSGIWNPVGYTTASNQASRLAIKNNRPQQLTALEHFHPLVSIASKMNVIESTTASGSKIQVRSPIIASLAKIQEIQDALDAVQSGFTFPEHLDFLNERLACDSSPLGYLDFTMNNGPVRNHKEALIRLQTAIDAIHSYDNKLVRMSRKKIVHELGQALYDLEEKVQRRLEEWRAGLSKQPGVDKLEKPHLEKPKLPVSEALLPEPFPESLQHVNGQPITPALTPEVCRLVGDDPRFHKVYMEMSSEMTKIQMRRIDALSKDQSTDGLDRELMVICQNWEEFVHSLIIVKRSEEKTAHAMLEWKSDLDLETDLDCDSHYLSLVLNPGDKENSP